MFTQNRWKYVALLNKTFCCDWWSVFGSSINDVTPFLTPNVMLIITEDLVLLSQNPWPPPPYDREVIYGQSNWYELKVFLRRRRRHNKFWALEHNNNKNFWPAMRFKLCTPAVKHNPSWRKAWHDIPNFN